MSERNGPAWFYGPGEQRRIFQPDEAIPAGWEDHPAKVKAHPLDHDADGEPGGSKPRRKKG